MKLRTPEQLRSLAGYRLNRRFVAVQRVLALTASENTARRCGARLSVITAAFRSLC